MVLDVFRHVWFASKDVIERHLADSRRRSILALAHCEPTTHVRQEFHGSVFDLSRLA
jgi:hypothetical protein